MQHDFRSDIRPADGVVAPYAVAGDRLLLTCGVAAALLNWAAIADPSAEVSTVITAYVGGLSLIWAAVFYGAGRRGWAVAAMCAALLFNPIVAALIDQDSRRVLSFAGGCGFAWTALHRYAAVSGRPWVAFAPSLLALITLSVVQFARGPSDGSGANRGADVTAEQMARETPTLRDPVGVDVDRSGNGLAAVGPPGPGGSIGRSGPAGELDPLSDPSGLTTAPGGLDFDLGAAPGASDSTLDDWVAPDAADPAKPPAANPG